MRLSRAHRLDRPPFWVVESLDSVVSFRHRKCGVEERQNVYFSSILIDPWLNTVSQLCLHD